MKVKLWQSGWCSGGVIFKMCTLGRNLKPYSGSFYGVPQSYHGYGMLLSLVGRLAA